MMRRSEALQIYDANRQYYGYSLKEWIELTFTGEISGSGYKKCSTCHRFKLIDNFTSEYSKKMLKICNFCQNRSFHKHRIDGGVSCGRHNGICNTRFIINIGNHFETNFRNLDLSPWVNTDPCAVEYRQRLMYYNKQINQRKVTCSCGAVIQSKSYDRHLKTKRCQDILDALNKKTDENDTESTKSGGSHD